MKCVIRKLGRQYKIWTWSIFYQKDLLKKKVNKHDDEDMLKGQKFPKELPIVKSSTFKQQNKVILDYKPKHMINFHDPMPLQITEWINKEMRENRQICAEEFQEIWVATGPSRRWSITPHSLSMGLSP
jgi:hypothetical protein